MASKIFLDANVLLDFTLKREGYETAKEVVALAVAGLVQAFITPAIVHIVGYWLSKAYGHAKAKQILLTLLLDIKVIDINHEVILTALHSKMGDIEDALQYYTAIYHKVDYFISSDKQLKKAAIPGLPVYAPKEFIKHFTA